VFFKTLKDTIREDEEMAFRFWACVIIAFVLKNSNTHFKKNCTKRLAVASSAARAASAPKTNKSLRFTDSINPRRLSYTVIII
jgi:hypothetical protein